MTHNFSTSSRRLSYLLAPLLLVAAVFLLYAPTLNYGFVWDDNLYVVNNQAVHDWSRAGEAFTSPRTTWASDSQYHIAEWRPLRNISYLIDHSLFGLNPTGYHLHNIALHAVAAVLLFYLIQRLFILLTPHGGALLSSPQTGAFARFAFFSAALYWAWHPIQTEVVAWVKSRDDLLATPLLFGALLLALPRTPQQHRPNTLALVLPVLLYGAALLSKENAVVLAAILPFLLFGITWSWFGPDPKQIDQPPADKARPETATQRLPRLRAAFWLAFGFGLLTLLYLALRDISLGRTAQDTHPGTFLQTLLTMAAAFLKYLQLILWPWPPTVQSADYDGFPLISQWHSPQAMMGLAAFVVLIVLMDATRRMAPLVSVGIALFLLAAIPYANIVPMMQIMAERFVYLPLAGLAVAFAGLLLCCHSLAPRVRWLLPLVLPLALGAATWQRLPVWESDVTLFDATRRANPDSWRPANQFTRALLRAGDINNGLENARQNYLRWPNDPDIVRTAAVANLLAGDEKLGVHFTRLAVRMQPDDYRASETLLVWQANFRPQETTGPAAVSKNASPE